MLEGRAVVAVGEILVEFVSHARGCGLERIGPYSGPYPSGAPAIVADQAARFGACAHVIGGVGADGFGRAALARLRADGVGTDGVAVSADRPTGTATVSYYDDGRRDFVFHLAGTAADAFPPPVLPDGPCVLHVSGASLGADPLRRRVMEAVRSARDRGDPVTCDPNVRPELMRDAAARDALWEAIDASAVLLPSTDDLGYLFPDLSEAAALDRLLAARAGIVALKRGAAGATVVGPDGWHDVAGHAVAEVDPTGAGDGFCGAFIACLVRGLPLAEVARLANAAGAVAVTRRGPMEGNSDPGEVAAFLSARQGTDA